jgi:hypothetical protein
MTTPKDSTGITGTRVPDEERMNTLPSHFGRHLLTVENAIYGWLRELSREYSGGYWHFYELSNGGFYMAPECESLQLRVDGNGYLCAREHKYPNVLPVYMLRVSRMSRSCRSGAADRATFVAVTALIKCA